MKKFNSMEYDGNFEFEGNKIFFVIDDDKQPIVHSQTGEEKLSRYFNYYDESGQPLGVISVYDTVEQLFNISDSYAKEKYLQLVKNKR